MTRKIGQRLGRWVCDVRKSNNKNNVFVYCCVLLLLLLLFLMQCGVCLDGSELKSCYKSSFIALKDPWKGRCSPRLMCTWQTRWADNSWKFRRESETWNTLQTFPGGDLNSAVRDLWATAQPVSQWRYPTKSDPVDKELPVTVTRPPWSWKVSGYELSLYPRTRPEGKFDKHS